MGAGEEFRRFSRVRIRSVTIRLRAFTWWEGRILFSLLPASGMLAPSNQFGSGEEGFRPFLAYGRGRARSLHGSGGRRDRGP